MPTPDLAEQHAALARALTSAGPAPTGFDAARLSLAAETLLAKRAASAAKAWPAFADSFAPDFHTRFIAYARTTPLRDRQSSRDDALRFAATLAARDELPPTAVRLLCAATARPLAWHITSRPLSLTIAVKLPRLRPRSFRVHVPRLFPYSSTCSRGQ